MTTSELAGIDGEALVDAEGEVLGVADGLPLGEVEALGEAEGLCDGDELGVADGLCDGEAEGDPEGLVDGVAEGDEDGDDADAAASSHPMSHEPVLVVPSMSSSYPAAVCQPPVLVSASFHTVSLEARWKLSVPAAKVGAEVLQLV